MNIFNGGGAADRTFNDHDRVAVIFLTSTWDSHQDLVSQQIIGITVKRWQSMLKVQTVCLESFALQNVVIQRLVEVMWLLFILPHQNI